LHRADDETFEGRIMSFANACVSALLRSPFHRLLSGSTDLIHYRGRRTGREITMPTQYAECGSDIVILAGRPDTKTWWQNFCTERDLDVLIRGQWTPMTASAVVGADNAAGIGPLLDAYLTRFPRALRTLGEGTPDDRAKRAVVVRCQPR
jgi:hypothetical protein